MISAEQRKEVRDYLLSKKLSLDLLMEIEDHFMSQIEELKALRNISFSNCFYEIYEKNETLSYNF